MSDRPLPKPLSASQSGPLSGRLARWRAWCLLRSGRLLRSLGRGPRAHGLTLQHFGIDEISLQQLQPALQRLSEDLGMTVRVMPYEGEAVLVDEYLQRSVSPQLLQALCEQRPVVVLSRDLAPVGEPRGRIAYARLREQVQGLLQGVAPGAPSVLIEALAVAEQIEAQALARAGGEAAVEGRGESRFESGFNSRFDSRFDSRYPAPAQAMTVRDEAETRLLQALCEGRERGDVMPLVLSYADGAMMVIDFAGRRVLLETAALDALRLAQQLPSLAPGATPRSGMSTRDLGLVLWDLGRAARQHALLQAPEDWWHTPLRADAAFDVLRHSRAPLDLALARVLARGGVTPSMLRRECRAGIGELRAFLQAGLLLGLLHWDPASG